MKKIITVLLISCTVLICIGCPVEEEDPDFVGSWRYSGAAEVTQVLAASSESYEFIMNDGSGEGRFTATILSYDEDAGHLRGEIDSVMNMGEWADPGDIQYVTYEIDGDVLYLIDSIDQGIDTYPSSDIFDTGTEGVDYWRFTKMN